MSINPHANNGMRREGIAEEQCQSGYPAVGLVEKLFRPKEQPGAVTIPKTGPRARLFLVLILQIGELPAWRHYLQHRKDFIWSGFRVNYFHLLNTRVIWYPTSPFKTISGWIT
jgi:hypothetical protein